MKRLLIVFLVFVQIVGCDSKQNQHIPDEQSSEIKFAKHFNLINRKDYKELQIISPKTNQIEHRYALVKKGVKLNLPETTEQIEIPVKNMAALSTTFIGMLNELKALDVVKITTDVQYVWNKTIQKRVKNGTVHSAGFESSLSPETILNKKVSLIVYSGFGEAFPNADKLKQLSVVCMPNYDWEEKHALGKAEWIKVFGALLDKDEEANAYFETLCKSYDQLKSSIQTKTKKPKAIVGGLNGDVWFAPSGNSYVANILKDAGIDYIYAKEKGPASLSLTLEQISKDEQQCDVWINAEATSLKSLIQLNDKYTYFQTVKAKAVYGYLHDSNYFWEMNAIHPEWLLSDFAIIAGHKKGKLHFYKQLK
ncbi:MAG: ABC transporter substrate-binding protein [Fluviicola sp.]|nr:ABC transporter substrate-binding protein [Fluviicola sp.]